jgi:hypothetical protein
MVQRSPQDLFTLVTTIARRVLRIEFHLHYLSAKPYVSGRSTNVAYSLTHDRLPYGSMLATTTNSMPAATMGFVRRNLGTITAIAGVESGDAAGNTFATRIQTSRFVIGMYVAAVGCRARKVFHLFRRHGVGS